MSIGTALAKWATPILEAAAKAGAKEAVDEGVVLADGEIDKVVGKLSTAVQADIAAIEMAVGDVINQAVNGVGSEVTLVSNDVDALTGKIVSAVTGLLPHF
jgi:hypothetical protein